VPVRPGAVAGDWRAGSAGAAGGQHSGQRGGLGELVRLVGGR
jgi:hypothetical protein